MKTEEKKRGRGRPRTLGPHVSFSIQLPDFVYAELNATAAQAGKSMGEVGRDILIEWLNLKVNGSKLIAGRPRKES